MGGWGGGGTVTLQQRGDTGFLVEEANLSTFVGEDEDGSGGQGGHGGQGPRLT